MVEKAIQLEFGEIIISTPPVDLTRHLPPAWLDNVVCYADALEGRGPLGGLYTCLKQAKFPHAFVAPVDSPTLPKSHICQVMNAHLSAQFHVTLAQNGDRMQPLIGAYDCQFHNEIFSVIEKNPAPVFRAIDRVAYQTVLCSKEELLNINTKADYHRLTQEQ